MHIIKRFYLLIAIIGALTIPLITFTSYIEVEPILLSTQEITVNTDITEITTKPTNSFLTILLTALYSIGALLFAIKFSINLAAIISKANKNPRQKDNNFFIVLLEEKVVPHTFLNYIFLNKSNYLNNEIPTEVLLHEKAHAKQKHSLDILFLELLQIIFWFNPLLYFTKKAIKLNHEFLADQAVINQSKDSSTYQNILLSFAANTSEPKLAHGINYSSIKKRFTLMKTQTSKKHIWIRSFLFLPLLGILLFSFSSTREVEKEVSKKNTENTLNKNTNKSSEQFSSQTQKTTLTINGITYNNQQLNLSKEGIENIILGTNTEAKISSFKFKLAGKPTVKCLGNTINETALKLLNNVNPGKIIQFFDIKTTKKDKLMPVLIKLVKKKYSNAPVIQKEKRPTLPTGASTNMIIPKPISDNATSKQKLQYQKKIKDYETRTGKKVQTAIGSDGIKYNFIATSGELTRKQLNDYKKKAREYSLNFTETPTPPSPPKSTLDHLNAMSKKGAEFYFNGDKITSDEAINIAKRNPKLNMTSQTNNGKSIVHLSKKGMTIINGKMIKNKN